MADPEILKGEEEDNVSAPSSFIGNAHYKIYAVYTGEGGLLWKILSQWGQPLPQPLPLNPPL